MAKGMGRRVAKKQMKKGQNSKRRKTKKIAFSTKIMLLLNALIIVLFICIWCYQFGQYQMIIRDEQSILDQIANDTQQKEQLEKAKNYQDSDAFIEEVARTQLNMIKNNEMKIVYEEAE